MPWQTPSIATVRQTNADNIAGKLGVAVIPNGEVRVLADANAANAGLNLEYLDWQAKQLLPDESEKQFLDRWGDIYIVNADRSRGRKLATFAAGTALVTATTICTLPAGAQFQSGTTLYQTTSQVTLGIGQNVVPLRALDPGAVGNLVAGTALSMIVAVVGVSGSAGISVQSMSGGADDESDDELRVRVLARIRQPPMGGCAYDYVAWALQVAGVTRAWCSPKEMGPGTVTVRVMCDDLRASNGGFPLAADLAAVQSYLELVRPVCGDVFVVAPIPTPVNFAVQNLVGDSIPLRAAIATSVSAMLARKAAPASQVNGVPVPAVNIPAAWVNDAVYQAVGGVSYDLVMTDAIMPNGGSLAVLGTIG
ncbi:MAG: baseplate J/gp47 family protein [Janthinobacterium lividum]